MGYTIGQELFRIILNKLLSGPLGKENPFFKILLKKGIGQILALQGVFKNERPLPTRERYQGP
ncbi:hypothetical protein BD749_3263 [Pontibacter ramchanderi]|uniref:Uncharacterized protein n=1 Tax=Pontibacter ramchanderi TaxID=1179743 RepID=A0A2N3U9J7_9BACT|nr:hypothetical protein BD749_3263 [Pontibacter ramchanderi]